MIYNAMVNDEWNPYKNPVPDHLDELLILRAYNGSLDAAKKFHDKMLTEGCSQYSIVTDPLCLKVDVCWWPDGLSEDEYYSKHWSMDNPARAWLVSVIDVLNKREKQINGQ